MLSGPIVFSSPSPGAGNETERLLAERVTMLERVLDASPAFIHVLGGPEFLFEYVNAAYIQLVGDRPLLGIPAFKAMPEAAAGGFPERIAKVMQRQEPFFGSQVPVKLARGRDGVIEERLIDLVYVPLIEIDGSCHRVLGHGVDVTDNVLARRTALNAATDQMARSEELAAADRRKDEFLATLAHELRNPLAPLTSALQMMRLAPENLGVIASARQIMERQVGNLVQLVDDLLDVARISTGHITLKRVLADLQTAMAAAVEISMPSIEAHHHRLVIDVPAVPILVSIDIARIAQVVSNLLNNAAKYTPNGGEIQLSATVEEEAAVVTVTDNGMGIPDEALASVFDMFTQVKQVASMSQGGLGIGLSLVKKMVMLHGGTVDASSEGLGKGSRFAVRLPLALPLGAESPSPAVERSVVRGSTGALRVLVVDDNVDAGEALAMLLEMKGHEAMIARDGPSGVAAAKLFKPHLAFIDIGMPGMDGYEVAALLRNSEQSHAATLVALTGWGAAHDIGHSLAAGFDEHLTKPADATDIERVLAHAAKGRGT